MCTICGHFAVKPRPSNDIYDMLVKMKHRGPDSHGAYLDDEVTRTVELEDLKETLQKPSRIALGHSRLSIIGGRTASQPFRSCDRKLVVIHNGEIYNYQKLSGLLQREHEIRTQSDSEVITHMLEEAYDGDLVKAVKRVIPLLDGMFAMAVTDGKGVVVVRDPIGKKPVYYIESDGVVYFSSEKKALWNGKDEPIRLPPSGLLYIDENGYKVDKVFELQRPTIDITDFEYAVKRYKAVLQDAIRKRLSGLTEEKVGVIFSGGIDSVLVAKLLQDAGQDVTCYCTGTPDSGDMVAARSVAEELGLPLKTTLITEEMVEGIIPEIIRNVEESGLLQVEVAIPMYLAAQAAAEDGIRVMYTGQAADELFAGYPWYNDVFAEGVFQLHEKLWEDLIRLYDDTLEREDKMTMAHSIELRAPYLDRDVIRIAMRISPKLKMSGKDDNMRKRVHRQAALEFGVPEDLAWRKKDPAQSGSGVHGMIESIVAREKTEAVASLVKKNISRDKGSLYRYGDGEYGEDAVRSYLQKIENDIKKQYIPPFLKEEAAKA